MLVNTTPFLPKTVLKMAKYKKQPNGSYMRYDVDGRFHAYIIDKKEVEIHYDLFVSPNSTAHFSPYMPVRHKEERHKLNVVIHRLKSMIKRRKYDTSLIKK